MPRGYKKGTAHKEWGMDEARKMKARQEKAIERYLGKKALLLEWEAAGINNDYVSRMRHTVELLHKGVINMGVDIDL